MASEERLALIEAFEATLRRPARFSHRRHGAQLDRALRRLDRYAEPGPGSSPGAGLDFALDWLADQARSERAGAEPVRSLGYLARFLDSASKRWRRAHKPGARQRAQAHREGLRQRSGRKTGARPPGRPGPAIQRKE